MSRRGSAACRGAWDVAWAKKQGYTQQPPEGVSAFGSGGRSVAVRNCHTEAVTPDPNAGLRRAGAGQPGRQAGGVTAQVTGGAAGKTPRSPENRGRDGADQGGRGKGRGGERGSPKQGTRPQGGQARAGCFRTRFLGRDTVRRRAPDRSTLTTDMLRKDLRHRQQPAPVAACRAGYVSRAPDRGTPLGGAGRRHGYDHARRKLQKRGGTARRSCAQSTAKPPDLARTRHIGTDVTQTLSTPAPGAMCRPQDSEPLGDTPRHVSHQNTKPHVVSATNHRHRPARTCRS